MINLAQVHEVVADAGDSLKETIEKFRKAREACDAFRLPGIAKNLEADLDLLEDILARFEGDES